MFALSKNPRKNLFLAPLQNITTAPYRRFCKLFHDIKLVCVPMLYMKQIECNPRTIHVELHEIKKEKPISLQLIGNDIEALKVSIEILESYDFDVLDINAGCPSRRAINSRCGGYLIKDLNLLDDLLQVAVNKSSKQISLKTRIGFTNTDNLKELALLINQSGIDFVVVHARTVKSKYDVRYLDLNAMKIFKEIVDIPLIGNGDIIDPITAKNFLDYTHVDGLMIGRASMGHPEIFSQIHDFLMNDTFNPINSDKQRMHDYLTLYEKVLDDFLEDINLKYSLEEYRLIELKRNAIWLTKDMEHSTVMRSELSKIKTLEQLSSILNNYFNEK